MDKENPLVSVVATTYTMERYQDITELLESLNAQLYRHFEIILVLEKSRELASKLEEYIHVQGYNNISLIFNTHPGGLSFARNIGVKNAKGEIIAFIDDDALASPKWIEQIVKALTEDDNIIGITGPILPHWENNTMSWFPPEFYWMFACTTHDYQKPIVVRNGYGTNMTFRKSAFETGGLFSTKLGANGGGNTGKHELIGEDTEFSMRIREKTGKSILYHPNVLVFHKAYSYRLKFGYIARRAYWEGYTKAYFKKLSYANQPEGALATEHKLLKRILLRLIPSIVVNFFTQPVNSAKKLYVTILTLAFVAIGYFRGKLHHFENEEAAI